MTTRRFRLKEGDVVIVNDYGNIGDKVCRRDTDKGTLIWLNELDRQGHVLLPDNLIWTGDLSKVTLDYESLQSNEEETIEDEDNKEI